MFGLNADRAGELYDKNKLGLGFDAEHKAVDRNLVVNRPVGKMKRSAGIVGALASLLTAAGITGRIGNNFFGNNARYQQALTNLDNAYK